MRLTLGQQLETRRAWGILAGAALIAIAMPYGAAPVCAAESAKVNFSRDILPILSDNCFFCHGPDPNNRKIIGPVGCQDTAPASPSDKAFQTPACLAYQ